MNRKLLILTLLALLMTTVISAQTFGTMHKMKGTALSSTTEESFVGATEVPQLATTTYDSDPASGPARRTMTMFEGETNQTDLETSDESPVGEPFVLLFFAALMGGVIYLRRRV